MHAAVLQLPDVLLEQVPVSVPVALQGVFDRLWQAWGYPRSFSYQARNGEVLFRGVRQ